MKQSLFTFLIVAFFGNYACGQINIDSIPIEYLTLKAKKYAFIRHIKPNMLEARNACVSLKMELVKIESKAENDFLAKMAFSKEGIETEDGIQYWIGASDMTEEGTWIWIKDNTQFYNQKTQTSLNHSYENWGKTTLGSQPNNVMKNGEDEDCIVIRKDGSWYDIGCKKRFAYVICEKKK